jgi:hypothetical protein
MQEEQPLDAFGCALISVEFGLSPVALTADTT